MVRCACVLIYYTPEYDNLATILWLYMYIFPIVLLHYVICNLYAALVVMVIAFTAVANRLVGMYRKHLPCSLLSPMHVQCFMFNKV